MGAELAEHTLDEMNCKKAAETSCPLESTSSPVTRDHLRCTNFWLEGFSWDMNNV